MNGVTKRVTKDCPLYMVKSIKALNLKDSRKQVNFYVLLPIHHLSVYEYSNSNPDGLEGL